MKSLLKSILRTGIYLIDQADGVASDVRDRAERVSDRVSEHVSDLADRSHDAIYGEDHTLRNVALFAAGVGVGVAAGILFAPSSGDELRSTVRDKVSDIGDRVRDRFTPNVRARSTGTEGGI